MGPRKIDFEIPASWACGPGLQGAGPHVLRRGK